MRAIWIGLLLISSCDSDALQHCRADLRQRNEELTAIKNQLAQTSLVTKQRDAAAMVQIAAKSGVSVEELSARYKVLVGRCARPFAGIADLHAKTAESLHGDWKTALETMGVLCDTAKAYH